MTIILEIPEGLAGQFVPAGQDAARAALEAIALEGYRSDWLSEADLRELLGFETRMEVHGFLKEHGAFLHYTEEDLEHDWIWARSSRPHVRLNSIAGQLKLLLCRSDVASRNLAKDSAEGSTADFADIVRREALEEHLTDNRVEKIDSRFALSRCCLKRHAGRMNCARGIAMTACARCLRALRF